MPRFSLTDEAHRRVGERLGPGAAAVDATAGNGHDTLFLARKVGPAGRVFAFDIQRQALNNSRARLEAAGCAAWVVFFRASHARLLEKIPVQYESAIQAVMFNLGYLPGGDKTIITRAPATVAALTAGLRLLAPGGILTVLAYPGHAGGASETAEVGAWCRQLEAAQFAVETSSGVDRAVAETPAAPMPAAPMLFAVYKKSWLKSGLGRISAGKQGL